MEACAKGLGQFVKGAALPGYINPHMQMPVGC